MSFPRSDWRTFTRFIPGALGNYGTVLGWSFDPDQATTTQQIVTNGRQYFTRIEWPLSQTVTNLSVLQTTNGGTLTSGQCMAALYNSAGTLLGYTADQSTAWAASGNNNTILTTGIVKDAAGNTITSLYVPGVPGDFIWASLHMNGTTAPTFRALANFLGTHTNFGVSAALFRGAFQNLSSTTAPAATITPASMSTLASVVWVGLT